MKKLSLAAALLIAGVSVVSAKPLAEAIENVDVSGSIVYRYDDSKHNVNNSTKNNNYKIGINALVPVNESVRLSTRFIVGANDLDFESSSPTNSSDSAVDVSLSEVFFSYAGIKNTVVNVGKRGLVTPWTVSYSPDNSEQTATGASFATTWYGVTLAAGYENQTNIDKSGVLAGIAKGSENIAAVALMTNVAGVFLDAWYADVSTIGQAYELGARKDFQFDNFSFGINARYSDITVEDSFNPLITKENGTLKLGIYGKVGIFDAKFDYVMTDKDGGLGAVDNRATSVYEDWNISSNLKADADLFALGVGIQALEQLHIALNWSTIEWDASKFNAFLNIANIADPLNGLSGKVEEEELYIKFTYAMSPKLSTYFQFGTYELKNDIVSVDNDYAGRLQIQYLF